MVDYSGHNGSQRPATEHVGVVYEGTGWLTRRLSRCEDAKVDGVVGVGAKWAASQWKRFGEEWGGELGGVGKSVGACKAETITMCPFLLHDRL